jgi:hypothetical protein
MASPQQQTHFPNSLLVAKIATIFANSIGVTFLPLQDKKTLLYMSLARQMATPLESA